MKRLEGGFGSSGAASRTGPDSKSETRAMYSPIIRVQVRVENLLRGAWFKDEPVDRPVVVQPAPNGT
jgi:hypothetical protein